MSESRGPQFSSPISDDQLLEAIAVGVHDGVAVLDLEGRVVFSNRALGEILGFGEDDRPGGITRLDLFPHAYPPPISPQAEAPVEGPSHVSESHTRTPQGLVANGPEERRLHWWCSPLTAPSGAPTGQVVVMHEVKERRSLDWNNWSSFSTVAHQYRSFVADMKLIYNVLLSNVLEPDEQREWLNRGKQQVEQLAHLVENFLRASQIESGQLGVRSGEVALHSLVRGVLDDPRHATKVHELRNEVPPQLPSVSADPALLSMALENLVDNAIKYSPQGGVVRVTAMVPHQDPGSVLVQVSDQGVGIPPEQLSSLFARFHRLTNPGTAGVQGLGLGLYIVKSLLEAQGGRIWATSQPGQGTTFSFALSAIPSSQGS